MNPPDLSLHISLPFFAPPSHNSDFTHQNGCFHFGYQPAHVARPRHQAYNLLHGRRRDFKPTVGGCGVRRSIRAPRMRWTTTLHAHFVHAVQLLGGHESNSTTKPITLNTSKLSFVPLINTHFCICLRSYTKISIGAYECQGSNPSSCQKPFAGTFIVLSSQSILWYCLFYA